MQKNTQKLGKKAFAEDNLNPPLSAIMNKSPDKGLFSVKGQIRDKKGSILKFSKMSSLKYKKVELKKYPNKWFIQFYYRIPVELTEEFDYKEWRRFKVYEGINSYKGKEQEAFANQLLKDVKEQLSLGFNPFAVNIVEKQTIEKVEQAKKVRLTNAIEQFLNQKEDKGRSKSTVQSYASYIAKIEAYLIASKQADIYVQDLNNEFFIKLMKWIEKEYIIGNRTYNNHVKFIILLLNWFESKPRVWVKILDFDFGAGTELETKTAISEKHTYFTQDAMKRLKNALAHNDNLTYYAMFIYYSCIRPDEIRHLKIENIDLQGKIIRIVGKTGHRVVPICIELSEMIESRNISEYPLTHYLIGFEGKVNSKMHSENYYSSMFRELREKAGLTDKFTLYGLKHTRVIHLINAGYNDHEIMQLTGHRDTASYDKYKRDLSGNIKSKMTGNTVVF